MRSQTSLDLSLFESNPAQFFEQAIKEFVVSNPDNQFSALDGEPIFEEPLVGFADGDDPMFRDYKTIIGDFHLTPREAFDLYLETEGREKSGPQTKLTVISWVVPISHNARLSHRREFIVPSLKWNHLRWEGYEFLKKLSHYVESLVRERGYQGVAPEFASFVHGVVVPGNRVSNWSQRHIAYAAGLGTFSLAAGFITARGIAIRVGEVVCDIPIPPTPRPYDSRVANCLFFHDGSCRRCIERCPVQAITEAGLNPGKCRDFLTRAQAIVAKEMGLDPGYTGKYPGCGLCQVKVPCEDRIPPAILKGRAK